MSTRKTVKAENVVVEDVVNEEAVEPDKVEAPEEEKVSFIKKLSECPKKAFSYVKANWKPMLLGGAVTAVGVVAAGVAIAAAGEEGQEEVINELTSISDSGDSEQGLLSDENDVIEPTVEEVTA